MDFNVDDFVKVDSSVIEKYHKKLIENFNKRGWALYNAGVLEDKSYRFLSEKELEACVSAGSEKTFIDPGFIYSLLPYVEDDSNWFVVRKAMEECVASGRYPFWVDLYTYEEEGQQYVKSKGVYLIDSVVFCEDNTWEFVIDYVLMTQLGIVTENNNNISLGLMHVYKILKQVMKRVR